MRPIDLSAATWRRSSYSNTNGGECVEVADGFTGVVPVRDSKNPGPAIMISDTAWGCFVDYAQRQ
ncbi:DUF397 domain-containing protein [Streptomyces kanamyceticus]|uniref:DUF397 domain-containing protein n=1 Tax=Streptomyces kanamyceticus TaxID=1967 RepID=A0A5J6GP76_STRKN|nr:DUF397 domain-containing protein [Streptomyces kanamyceticus]QEU94826.1 DUF397 domain-containing protein [Streptomyces kanamyceticus]